jgi:DNA polymerase III sliding clamp (beta) subunit (PCNA family)
MKFQVRQNELEKALNRIKTSKALGRPEEENFSSILIQAKKENEKNKIFFISSNTSAWASSVISQEYFETISGDDHEKYFSIEEEGEVFVDGHTLINIINAYPQGININFEVKTDKSKDGSEIIRNLVTSFSQKMPNGKNQKRTNKYLIKEPSYFSAQPPQEERKEIKVSCKKFEDAILSVEFASSTDEKHRQLWGCFVEIHDDGDVSACATDKSKICWYDTEGLDRPDSEKAFKINPIKTTLVAAIKSLDSSKELTIKSGEKFIILQQDDQWHGIPTINVISEASDSDFKWREISKNISDLQEVTFKIPRKTLAECVKTSTATLGSKYGMKINFNSEQKKVNFSVQKIEGGGIVNSDELEMELDDSQIIGETNTSIFLTIDSLKEVVTRYSSEDILVRLKDNDTPIEFISEKNNFRYITATVDPPVFSQINSGE